MISVQHWDAASKTCRACTAAELPATRDAVGPDDVVWVDLSDPTPEEEELVFGKFFPVHALTREDVTRVRTDPTQGSHLPKVEEFPDYLFVIANPLPPGLAESLRGAPKDGQRFSAATALARKFRP